MKKKIKSSKRKIYKSGAIMLSLSMIWAGVISVSAQSVTDADSDIASTIPDVTESDVSTLLQSSDIQTGDSEAYQTYIYEINSADNLESFVTSVNDGGLDYSDKTINLNCDIVWNDTWQPIKNFNGTFNGNGYTVSGLDDEFIILSNKEAEIKDLTISSDIEKLGNTGGIVSINLGTISNCTFSGKITSDDNQNNADINGCGGIAGLNTGRIENCSTDENAVISRDGMYVGGIAGINLILEDDVAKTPQLGIYDCTNYAEINCTKAENKNGCGATGGIAGFFDVLSSSTTAIEAMSPQLENCINYGEIHSVGAATGGIAGLCANTKVNECTNLGCVTQTNSLWTGGIVGSFNQTNYYIAADDDNHNILYVNNCTNNGEIKGVTRVGGIIGGDLKYESMLFSQALMNINNCINTGNIFTTGYAGGMSGYCFGDVSRCINTGDIYLDLSGQDSSQGGYNAIGGIVSRTYKTISDCINIGVIKVNTDEPLPFTAYSGGIIGIVDSSGQIVRCCNSAPVTGNHISSTEESISVLYGGISGKSSTSCIIDSIFNNSVSDMAQRAVASYIGEDSDHGLTASSMTGTNAIESLSALFEGDNFEVAENAVVDGVTYQFIPNLKNMPTLYEIDPEKALANASYAFLQITFPDGEGYTIEPVEGYDPMNVPINGDIAFSITVDDAYKDYDLTVTSNGTILSADKNGIYSLTNLTSSPVIEVKLSAPATEPTTEPTTGSSESSSIDNSDKQSNNSTEDTSDNSTVKTGNNNGLAIFITLLLLAGGFTAVSFFSRKKFNNPKL